MNSKKPRVKYSNISNEEKYNIRKIVDYISSQRVAPTAEKILQAMKQDESIPKISMTTLTEILEELGYVYLQNKEHNPIHHRLKYGIMLIHFVNTLKKHRDEGKPVYYILNVNMVIREGKNKQKPTILDSVTTDFHHPKFDGKCLTILNIANEKGFIPGCQLLIESEKVHEYEHFIKRAKAFDIWYKDLLPKLEPNTAVCMDKPFYFSRRIAPMWNWSKELIAKWLTKNRVPFEEDSTRSMLLMKAKDHLCRNKCNLYAIEKNSMKRNIAFLQIPPYYYELNPMYPVWADFKRSMDQNDINNMSELKTAVENSMMKSNTDKWDEYFNNVVQEEKKHMMLINVKDEVEEEFIENEMSSDDEIEEGLSDYDYDSDF